MFFHIMRWMCIDIPIYTMYWFDFVHFNRVYISISHTVREARTDGQRIGNRFGGRGTGRGGRGGFNRESADDENSFGNNNGFSGGYRASENGDADKATERRAPRYGNRGGRRGGYTNGDATEGERPRRVFERRSGTGRGLVLLYILNLTQ